MTNKSTGDAGPRPIPLAPNIAVLETLAAQMPGAKWGLWGYQLQGSDWKKPPVRISGGKLRNNSCDQPAQWGEFGAVRADFDRVRDGGGADGFGLLMGGGGYQSVFVAVDIDNVLNSDGSLLESVPKDVVLGIEEMQRAEVYIERSPSGNGLRALWVGSKPDDLGREKITLEGISREMYDGGTQGRYVTLTGQAWQGAPLTITEQSTDFAETVADWLTLFDGQADGAGAAQVGGDAAGVPRNLPTRTDAEIIAKVKQGGGAGKGARLWAGNMSDFPKGKGEFDQSVADSHLCNLIAQWTDDLIQIERIWLASGLPKADEKRQGNTPRVRKYRATTVAGALASARKFQAEKAAPKMRQTERVDAALKAGDTSGALASALANWGGKIPATMPAAQLILNADNRLAGAFAYDEFSSQVLKLRSLRQCLGDVAPPDREPELGQAVTDIDIGALTVWLEFEWGLRLKSIVVGEALELAARHRSINVVVDALEALQWDGVKRLDTWLVDYMQADTLKDSARYLQAIGPAWMIGTVARAYEPGVKHDHTLTMQSVQQGLVVSHAAVDG